MKRRNRLLENSFGGVGSLDLATRSSSLERWHWIDGNILSFIGH